LKENKKRFRPTLKLALESFPWGGNFEESQLPATDWRGKGEPVNVQRDNNELARGRKMQALESTGKNG